MNTKYLSSLTGLRNKKGFSLIELLLILAIVAALAVAAFIVYPKVQAARAAEQEAKIITSAVASIKALYSSRDYRTVTSDVAANADVFPSEMVMADGTLQNKWGGTIVVSPSTGIGSQGSSGSTRRYFRIVYRNVPPAVCQKLVGLVEPYFVVMRVSSVNGATGDGTMIKNSINLDEYMEFNPDDGARKCKNTSYEGNPTDGIAIVLVSD